MVVMVCNYQLHRLARPAQGSGKYTRLPLKFGSLICAIDNYDRCSYPVNVPLVGSRPILPGTAVNKDNDGCVIRFRAKNVEALYF